MGVGERLKIALYANDMSIKNLHETSGISLNTLYAITKRDSKNIDVAILDKISRALELPRTFFTSEQPYTQLELLYKFKAVIVAHIEDAGIDILNGRTLYEMSDIEYLKTVGRYVKSTSKGLGNCEFSFELHDQETMQIAKRHADNDIYSTITQFTKNEQLLFSAFSNLNDEGQEKAVDYVQLLAENEKYLK